MPFRNRTDLRLLLRERLGIDDLRELCFDHQVKGYDVLPERMLLLKIIEWFEHRNKENEFVEWLSKNRSDIYNDGIAAGIFDIQRAKKVNTNLTIEAASIEQEILERMQELDKAAVQFTKVIEDIKEFLQKDDTGTQEGTR